MSPRRGMSGPPPKDVDAYLAAQPPEYRRALNALRKTIKSAAPKAVEVISYHIPIFKLDGKHLVGMGGFAGHCSFFVMSGEVMESFSEELKGWKTSKGTIQFTPEDPLPAALVKKIVKARVAEAKVPW